MVRSKTKTASIIRPVFARWLPAKTHSSNAAEISDEACKTLTPGSKDDRDNPQDLQARIDDCHQKLALLEYQQFEIDVALQSWSAESGVVGNRLDLAAGSLRSAKDRLERAGEKLPLKAKQQHTVSVLQESYLNFDRQAALLKQKQVSALARLTELEGLQQLTSQKIQNLTALLEQLQRIADADNGGLKQAA